MFDPNILAGKRILVTGGGSGLGLSMSRAFVQHGARVAIVGRSADRLRQAAEQIDASGARVLTTLLHAMQQRGAKRGIASLCLGGGNGVALAVER